MSEPSSLSEIETLAAEHALGVLSARERAEAELRIARDPAFAALVVEWRERLAPLAMETPEAVPPPHVWTAIARTLPANDDAGGVRQLRRWRRVGMGSLALSAASLAAVAVLATRPPTVIAPPVAPLLSASLVGEARSAPLFLATYDPARQALLVTSLVPPGSDPAHVHQLWVIPSGGKPRSLGMIEPGASKALPMVGDTRDMLAAGSTIAVSVEPPGGSPSPDGPSGPVAATGRLAKI